MVALIKVLYSINLLNSFFLEYNLSFFSDFPHPSIYPSPSLKSPTLTYPSPSLKSPTPLHIPRFHCHLPLLFTNQGQKLTPFGPQPKGQGQAKVVMIASALAVVLIFSLNLPVKDLYR